MLLLVGGAYFAAQPWLACAFPFGPGRWYLESWGLCAFGTGNPAFDRTGPGPHWPSLVGAAVYVIAAAYVALGRVTIGPARESG